MCLLFVNDILDNLQSSGKLFVHDGRNYLSHHQEGKGTWSTPNLKPSEEVAEAASVANSMLGRIRRTFSCLDEHILVVPIYKALVRPRMEFDVQAWCPYLQKDILKLEKVPRRATKLIPFITDLPYEDRLTQEAPSHYFTGKKGQR